MAGNTSSTNVSSSIGQVQQQSIDQGQHTHIPSRQHTQGWQFSACSQSSVSLLVVSPTHQHGIWAHLAAWQHHTSHRAAEAQSGQQFSSTFQQSGIHRSPTSTHFFRATAILRRQAQIIDQSVVRHINMTKGTVQSDDLEGLHPISCPFAQGRFYLKESDKVNHLGYPLVPDYRRGDDRADTG